MGRSCFVVGVRRVVTTSAVTVEPVRRLSLRCPSFSSEVNHFPVRVAVTLESITRLRVSTGSQVYQLHDNSSRRGQGLKELVFLPRARGLSDPGLNLVSVSHFLVSTISSFLISCFLISRSWFYKYPPLRPPRVHLTSRT